MPDGHAPHPRAPIPTPELERDDPHRAWDADGRLLFEYDPKTGRSVLHVPEGDLELRADHGGIKLRARDGVAVLAGRGIEIAAGHVLRFAAGSRRHEQPSETGATSGDRAEVPTPGEEAPSSFTMHAAGAFVRGPAVELEAQTARLVAGGVEVLADRVRSTLGVMETRAERIVERARDHYRDVERLSQTRAGRLRMIAETTAHLLGDRTQIKAREDLKLKGRKIHIA